jgi:hypothetical protein
MQRLKALALVMLGVFAFAAIAATSAEAKEGPFYKICTEEKEGKCEKNERLKKGQGKKVIVAAQKEFVLGTSVQKIKCTELAGPATLMGSEPGTAGSSEEVLTFKNCTVSGNNKEGKECGVENKEIQTNALINTLDKENQVATHGEKFLVSFRPKEVKEKVEKVFVKVKFAPAGNCVIPETAIELAAGATLGVAGVAENEAQEAVQLELASETFGVSGYIKFPETLLKTEWVEEAGKVKEIKEGLVAFSKAVTVFTGQAKLTLEGAAKQWGVFGK